MARPRFFKIFSSRLSSESMVIPASCYDELPLVLPKTALLQGSGRCFWKGAILKRQDEVYFGQGWAKFVEDNRLRDGDVMTFSYEGSRNFKVTIYGGSGGCTEIRAVAQVIAVDDDKEDTNTSSEPEMANTVPRTRNKGKKKAAVVDSEESFMSEDSNNMSDRSYSPSNEDTALYVTPNVANSRKNGESRSLNSIVGSTSNNSRSVSRKRPSTIKNPEVYLDDPENPCFVTLVKNRISDLRIPQQLVKDYLLKFQEYVWYIDNYQHGNLLAKSKIWKDGRVCIKKWCRFVKRYIFIPIENSSTTSERLSLV